MLKTILTDHPMQTAFFEGRSGEVNLNADILIRNPKYAVSNSLTREHSTFRDAQEKTVEECAREYWGHVHAPVIEVLRSLDIKAAQILTDANPATAKAGEEMRQEIANIRSQISKAREVYVEATVTSANYAVTKFEKPSLDDQEDCETEEVSE